MIVGTQLVRQLISLCGVACILFPKSASSNPPLTSAPEAILIADYRFNGDATDSSGHSPDFNLEMTQIVTNTLLAAGDIYGWRGTFRDTATIPAMNTQSFTFSMEFMPLANVSQENKLTRFLRVPTRRDANIVSVMLRDRMVAIGRDRDNSLNLTLYPGKPRHFVHDVVKVHQWNHIVCTVNSVDEKMYVVQVFLNGVKLNTIHVSEWHSHRILQQDYIFGERQIGMVDICNPNSFYGYVDNLKVFSPALDDAASLALTPEHPLGVRGKSDAAIWILGGAGLVIFCVLTWLAMRRQEV